MNGVQLCTGGCLHGVKKAQPRLRRGNHQIAVEGEAEKR